MQNIVSVRKFSLVVEVSHTAVLKAIREGRLTDSVKFDLNGSPVGIDIDKGKQEWALNNPSPVREEIAKVNNVESKLPSGPSYAQARAVRENYMARIAKLLFEEKIGKLVDADAVKLKSFETARTIRDYILNIPNRISSELASETDPVKIHAMLTKEFTDSRNELSRLLKNGD